MISIIVNGIPVSVKTPIDEPVTSLDVISFGETIVSKKEAKKVAKHIYQLCMECDGEITFNGRHIDKSMIKQPNLEGKFV